MAALLHRGQAERQGRGHRLQSRRFRGARQQRPGRQVREHRQPRGEVHHRALRRQARCDRAGDAAWRQVALLPRRRELQCASRSPTATHDREYRQGDARGHGSSPTESTSRSTRRSPGSSPRNAAPSGAAAERVLAQRSTASACSPCILAPVLPALARERAEDVPRADDFAWARRPATAAAGASDRRLLAPHGAHRPEADRRAARGSASRRDRAAPARGRGCRATRCRTPRRSLRRARDRSPSTISPKIDLRIARIVNAEHVDGADKLLKLTLDVGEGRHAHGVRRHQVGVQARAT